MPYIHIHSIITHTHTYIYIHRLYSPMHASRHLPNPEPNLVPQCSHGLLPSSQSVTTGIPASASGLYHRPSGKSNWNTQYSFWLASLPPIFVPPLLTPSVHCRCLSVGYPSFGRMRYNILPIIMGTHTRYPFVCRGFPHPEKRQPYHFPFSSSP